MSRPEERAGRRWDTSRSRTLAHAGALPSADGRVVGSLDLVLAGHPIRPDRLSFGQKLEVLLFGIELPRPENRLTPRDVGLEYERHVFAGGRGIPLEAWFVPATNTRGTVVLFHGHAASKDSQLGEARAFHAMGLGALLVDFYGSGGSGGSETSIGFYEALDVAKAFDYARGLPEAGPIVLC